MRLPTSRGPYGAGRRRTASACLLLACVSCTGTPDPAPSPRALPRSTDVHCLISPAEVTRATGKAVGPPIGQVTEAGGCVLRFADAGGGVNIAVESHRTSRAARDYVESGYRDADLCCTLRRIPGLGQDAVSISGRSGTSVLVQLGHRDLVVTVDPGSIDPRVAAEIATTCASRL